MSGFEITDYLLQAECDELAQEIFDEVLRDHPDDSEDSQRDLMIERAWETVDGHQWAIYTHKALMVCTHCNVDRGEERLAEMGMPNEPTLGSLALLIVYGEMEARIVEALEDLWDAREEAEE